MSRLTSAMQSISLTSATADSTSASTHTSTVAWSVLDTKRSQAGLHANGHISSHLKARTASSTLHTFTNVHPRTSPLDERITFSRYAARRHMGQLYRKHQHKQLHGGLPSSTIRPDLRFTPPYIALSLLPAPRTCVLNCTAFADPH
jgi:hypothetical protein